jgi:hypothetical protein
MNIDKLVFEEIEKFKLFSKYSPKKTLTENEIVLSEQTKTTPQKSYELMISGAKGPGTNPKKIIDGINQLKNASEFYELNSMFKDKKTGYNSFQDMIRGEFEFIGNERINNGYDLDIIAKKLKELSVPFTYGKKNLYKDFTVAPQPVFTSQTEKKTSPERQQHINSMYCSVKNGVIKNPASNWDGDKWEHYVLDQKVTTEEIEVAKKTCPNRDNPSEDPNKVETKTQKKLNWNPEEFPLQYMDQGPNVKKLQQALDVRNKVGKPNITGKFYNATQAALDKKAKELGLSYDRNQGLTKDDFNKIIAARETYSSGGAYDFDTRETLQQRDQQQKQSERPKNQELDNLGFGD